MTSNELKIDLYPEKEPRYDFHRYPLSSVFPKDTLCHSLDPKKELGNMKENVPVLNGFYIAHCNHYPIRIRPDDIWLLIVQAFSYYVNSNSDELRSLFVDFDGKKTIEVKYPLSSIDEVNKSVLENFSEQINKKMEEYLGEKLIDVLTPNFTTTDYNSTIVCKISIMGAFKNYFNYQMMLCGCGFPYIIIEGTAEDYQKIISKAKELEKYKFEWYLDKVIPHIEKMKEAKEGKIDVDYFKNMLQKKEVIEQVAGASGIGINDKKIDYLSGWFLNFFAYYDEISSTDKKNKPFKEDTIKVENLNKLACQMLDVPFTIIDDVHKKTYKMKYKVGFVGCDQNDKKEVSPVQGWYVLENSDVKKIRPF